MHIDKTQLLRQSKAKQAEEPKLAGVTFVDFEQAQLLSYRVTYPLFSRANN